MEQSHDTNTRPGFISVKEALDLHSSNNRDVVFLDGSFKRSDSIDGKEEYIRERIPGAVYFDIKEFSMKECRCPPMLPTTEEFNESASALGISNSSRIVVYGGEKACSIARVWWMFRSFGHENVWVMEGGLERWKEAGGPIASGEPSPLPRGDFRSCGLHAAILATREQVLGVCGTNNDSCTIVDVRPPSAFSNGRISKSVNLPPSSVLIEGNFTAFQPPEVINKRLSDIGVTAGQKVIFSCNSGVMASILILARYSAGEDIDNSAMYDGSYSEWVLFPDMPIDNDSEDVKYEGNSEA